MLRMRREEFSAVKHDKFFTCWKILIGNSDWRDHSKDESSKSKYRLHNLPSKTAAMPGVYELGIVRPAAESRRKKKKKELRKRDVVAVYIGQADNVRQRLQSYGQGGSHLEGWSGLERWLPEKRIVSQFFRPGPRLFSEIFSRGYSLAFRWASTDTKEAAELAEQKLLRAFDYAWNKGANGSRRSLEILTRLEMQSHVMCGTRSSAISRGFRWPGVFKRRAGIKLERLKKPREENRKRLVTRLVGMMKRFLGLSLSGNRGRRLHAAESSSADFYAKRSGQKENQLYGVRVDDLLVSRRKLKPDKKCGVMLENRKVCEVVAVRGRKRCEIHRGMRISARKSLVAATA